MIPDATHKSQVVPYLIVILKKIVLQHELFAIQLVAFELRMAAVTTAEAPH